MQQERDSVYVRFSGTTIISSTGQRLLMGFYPDNKVKKYIFAAKEKYEYCVPVFSGLVKGGEYNEKENCITNHCITCGGASCVRMPNYLSQKGNGQWRRMDLRSRCNGA